MLKIQVDLVQKQVLDKVKNAGMVKYRHGHDEDCS